MKEEGHLPLPILVRHPIQKLFRVWNVITQQNGAALSQVNKKMRDFILGYILRLYKPVYVVKVPSSTKRSKQPQSSHVDVKKLQNINVERITVTLSFIMVFRYSGKHFHLK